MSFFSLNVWKKKVFKIFKSWQVCDWLAKWIIMLGFMDLRWPRVLRRSNVGIVWLCMKSHKWKFTKVSTTVHDNIFEVLIVGLISYLYSWFPSALFYLHHGTNHIGSCWHTVFAGGPWPVIWQTPAYVEMARFFVHLRRQCFINSLRLSVAYVSVNWPSLIQIMACRLCSTKPFSEPMLEYC